MKTSLEIINKLSEKEDVKLESQLVELGVIQDITSLLKQGQDLNTSASSTIDNARIKFNESLKPLLSAEKLILKTKEQAKSLGLEIPKETIAIFDRVDSFIKSSNDSLNKIKNL